MIYLFKGVHKLYTGLEVHVVCLKLKANYKSYKHIDLISAAKLAISATGCTQTSECRDYLGLQCIGSTCKYRNFIIEILYEIFLRK